MHDPLENYGWNAVFARSSELYQSLNLSPARVAETDRDTWTIIARNKSGNDTETLRAVASGRFAHAIAHPADMPVTGDWVLIDREHGSQAVIHAVLPRTTKISRKAKGETAHEQNRGTGFGRERGYSDIDSRGG